MPNLKIDWKINDQVMDDMIYELMRQGTISGRKSLHELRQSNFASGLYRAQRREDPMISFDALAQESGLRHDQLDDELHRSLVVQVRDDIDRRRKADLGFGGHINGNLFHEIVYIS